MLHSAAKLVKDIQGGDLLAMPEGVELTPFMRIDFLKTIFLRDRLSILLINKLSKIQVN